MSPTDTKPACCPSCGQSLPSNDFIVDLDHNQAMRHGRTVKVTRQQTEILFTLNKAMPRVVSAEKLISAVYGAQERPIDEASVIRTQICRMRKTVARLGIDIRAELGRGYYLQLSEEPPSSSPVSEGKGRGMMEDMV